MSTIDKQRIAAVRILVDMGYVFLDEWIAPMGRAGRRRRAILARDNAEAPQFRRRSVAPLLPRNAGTARPTLCSRNSS